MLGKILLLAALLPFAVAAAAGPRARDLGVPFTGTPGPLNAITDVAGVEVGHTTLVSGSGKLVRGAGPVRTGVTAVLPRGSQVDTPDPVFAAWYSLNGNGEMTGTTWVEESGQLYGPVMITNTHSVGTVRDAVIAWTVAQVKRDDDDTWSLPVVAETWDGWLNDINGFHVKPEHAVAAIERAAAGPVTEGSVGGGTGMICFHFKCGIGTASRRIRESGQDWMLGVLVQANFGSRRQLVVAGVPVGEAITEHPAYVEEPGPTPDVDTGSIIVVVATDAPLLPHQLKRIARRAGLGIARTGGTASDSSGDIFISFSTAPLPVTGAAAPVSVRLLPNEAMTAFFQATAEATEEAIVNALVAAEPMTGVNDRYVMALPHDRLRAMLKRHRRLAAPR